VVLGAKHIHTLAEAYGATVILHTDHCAKIITLVDGLLDASRRTFCSNRKAVIQLSYD
jgi:fructose-bisphosphate aldolase class II